MQVGVGDPLAGDQGLLHETHHIPSHNKVRSVLVKPVHTMPFVESTPLNTESTKLSPAVQYPSALLNNGEKQEVLFNLLSTILLKMLLLHKDALDHLLILRTYTQKEMCCCYFCWSFTHAVHFLCNMSYISTWTLKQDQQQKKKVDCRRPCSSEEAMIAFQTSSTEEVSCLLYLL